jgi:hypothetical protein
MNKDAARKPMTKLRLMYGREGDVADRRAREKIA